MPGKLSNLTIIGTRQDATDTDLQRLLAAHACTYVNLPLFAIEATLTQLQLRKIDENLQCNYLIIFISRNAIESVLPKIQLQNNTQWATIGPGTAKYLQKYNISNIIYPQKPPYNGKSLIAELQHKSINFKNSCIMILTGEQGDDWLATELQSLGARVEQMPVYKRVMPKISVAKFKSVINARMASSILVITCITSLVNLQTLGMQAKINVYDLPLLVISERIYAYAKLHGFVNIILAKSTNATDILAALLAI